MPDSVRDTSAPDTPTHGGQARQPQRPKRVETGPDGEVYILDVRGGSFGNEFTYVFGRNVARAREENERLTGNPDGRLPAG